MSAKPLMKPSGIRAVAIGSAIAIAVAGFGIFSYFMLRFPSQSSVASPPSPPTEAIDAVSALGRLEPEGGVMKIAAPSSGFGSARVERLLVKEGSIVKPKQPLAVMDNFDALYAAALQADAQVKEARSRLSQVQSGAKAGDVNAQRANVLKANAGLPKAEAEVLKADAELKNAQWEYQRYQKLFKDGAVSELDLQNRQLIYETKANLREQAKQASEQAKLELEGAKQVLSSVAEVRPTDVQQAVAQVQVADANLQKAKAELEKAVVRAPIAGQVLKIHTDPGEVAGNDGILELGKTGQMYVVAEVDENYINRIRPGQKAKITSYAFPGEITGTVDKVGLQIRKNEVLNSDPVDKTDTRIVEVKVRLDNSQAVAGLTNLQVKVAIVP